MGLRGFGPWLRSKFPAAFHSAKLDDIRYDAVYIDVNTILYANARVCRSGDHILRAIGATLHNIITNRCCPSTRLFLAVDGAASVPKLMLQRERRRMNGERAERDGRFDCRQFTPGCLFMGRLSDGLVSFGRTMLRSSVLDAGATEVVVDPGTRAGEGEFKILQDINTSPPPRGSRIAIISSDTDLFLYPLMIEGEHDIDIHLPFTSPSDSSAVMSIKGLKRLLQSDFGHDNFADFVVMALLSGNDYLPALPWGTLKSMYDGYLRYLSTKPSKYAPFYDPRRGQLCENGFKTFLGHYRSNELPPSYRPGRHSTADGSNYYSLLDWLLGGLRRSTDFSNKLANVAAVEDISFDSLTGASWGGGVTASQQIEYIPGAIGMALLSPEGTARSFLPRALAKMEDSSRTSWWQHASACEILAFYNTKVAEIQGSLSDKERAAVVPGRQIRVR